VTLSRRRVGVVWAGLSFLVILFSWGCVEGGLFTRNPWEPAGQERLIYYSAIWAGVSALLGVHRGSRRLLPPLMMTAGLAGTVLAVGPRAVLATLLFLASSYVVGRALTRRWDDATWLSKLLALLTGVAAWMFLIGLMVHLPVNYPLAYLVLLVAPVIWRLRDAAEGVLDVAEAFGPRRLGVAEYAAASACGFAYVAQLMVSWKPEVGADALAMHLVIPATILQEHVWRFPFEHVVWAVMPMGANWCFTATYLLGGEEAARLLNAAMLAVAGSVTFLLCRTVASRGAALMATALLISSPIFQLLTGSLFVENLLTAVLAGAIAALWKFKQSGRSGWLAVSFALLGAGCATKFGALAFTIFGIGAGVALWWRTPGRRLRVLALSLLALVVLGSVPYVNAYVKTGNPVFPFMNHIFRSPAFEAAPIVDSRFQSPLTLTTPYDVTFHTPRFLESQNGGWGFHYFLFVPLVLLVWRRGVPGVVVLCALVGTAFFVTAYWITSNLRYLTPSLPLFTVCIAWAFSRLTDHRWLARGVMAVAGVCFGMNMAFLAASGWYHRDFFLNPLDPSQRVAYLERSAPERLMIERLNSAYPEEPVIFVGTNATAELTGKAYSTSWHHYGFERRLRECPELEACLEVMDSAGARLLVWRNHESSGESYMNPHLERILTRWSDTISQIGRVQLLRLQAKALERHADGTFAAFGGETAPVLPAGSYDDQHPSMTYRGAWIRDSQFSDARGHSLTYSREAGAQLQVRFRGHAIRWYYTRAANRGLARVEIDGAFVRVVDLYSASTEWQAKSVFEQLGPGEHELRITVLADRTPGSSDGWVDIDAIEID
jgi:4-amino-4-deoxy-L-arabinose transferase-like glycosyltransferase